MKLSYFLSAAASLAAIAAAKPTKTIDSRAAAVAQCSPWASVQTGSYTVYNNLWGEDSASSGSQYFGVDGLSGTTLKWHTSWSWTGSPTHVKSYANAVVSLTPTPLASISSIPSSWNYTQTGTALVADISYDIFTSSTPSGPHAYEIMIWLSALGGAGPISTSYDADGAAEPIATTLAIEGGEWNLYKGVNAPQTVFSFVATGGVEGGFRGDLMGFSDYLVEVEGVEKSQFVTSIGAGTEPFTGSDAELTVTGYSTTIEYV